MPEGPEVRKYADALDAALSGRAIESFQAGAQPFPRLLEVKAGLQCHPELAGRSEIVRKPNCCIGSDRPLAENDFVDAPRWNSDRASEGVLADSQGEQELLQKHLTGMVIEVSYMTRMPGGKLRHPQFKRIRTDKTAEECTR